MFVQARRPVAPEVYRKYGSLDAYYAYRERRQMIVLSYWAIGLASIAIATSIIFGIVVAVPTAMTASSVTSEIPTAMNVQCWRENVTFASGCNGTAVISSVDGDGTTTPLVEFSKNGAKIVSGAIQAKDGRRIAILHENGTWEWSSGTSVKHGEAILKSGEPGSGEYIIRANKVVLGSGAASLLVQTDESTGRLVLKSGNMEMFSVSPSSDLLTFSAPKIVADHILKRVLRLQNSTDASQALAMERLLALRVIEENGSHRFGGIRAFSEASLKNLFPQSLSGENDDLIDVDSLVPDLVLALQWLYYRVQFPYFIGSFPTHWLDR